MDVCVCVCEREREREREEREREKIVKYKLPSSLPSWICANEQKI